MQKWTCGACGQEFLVDQNDSNLLKLKEAMEHMMNHQGSDYDLFNHGFDKILLNRISNN